MPSAPACRCAGTRQYRLDPRCVRSDAPRACPCSESRVAARESKSRPAARLRLLSGDRRRALETPQAPSEAAASSAAVLLRSPTVSELIDLLACKVDGLRCGFLLRRFMSCDPASPSSTSRRMASERSGLSVCLAAQASTFSRNSDESRIAVTGSRPVAGRPLFFRTTFLRDAFIFLVLPKEATTTCPKDRGRACGMGVRGQSWRASATTTAAPITSAARFSPRGPLGISNLYVWNHVEKGRITPASDF